MSLEGMLRGLTTAVMLVMLSACVTETIGPVRESDPAAQLKAYIDLGVGYIRNGNYNRARENLQQALDLDSRSPEAHNAMALLYQVEGEYELAERHFKSAISNDGNFTQARNNYGAFLFARDRYAEAIKELQIASEDRTYANRAQVFENLGVSYMQLGKVSEADQSFVRSLQLNQGQRRALLELALIRFDQKNYLESRGLYRRHVASAQQSARSLLLCVKLARIFESDDDEASCSLMLKNIFPNTDEYREYQSLSK